MSWFFLVTPLVTPVGSLVGSPVGVTSGVTNESTSGVTNNEAGVTSHFENQKSVQIHVHGWMLKIFIQDVAWVHSNLFSLLDHILVHLDHENHNAEQNDFQV